jgi:hypothetical protein
MKNNRLIYILGFIIGIIIIYFIVKKTSIIEPFQIDVGMLNPQNKFYAKCTDTCYRDISGDSSPGQFKWLCTDSCQEKANNRILAGVPDLTDMEYERHNKLDSCLLANDRSMCYCLKDRKQDCEQKCAFSRMPFDVCTLDCMRTRASNCLDGLYGGGLFL